MIKINFPVQKPKTFGSRALNVLRASVQSLDFETLTDLCDIKKIKREEISLENNLSWIKYLNA